MARKSRKDIGLIPIAETCEKIYKTAIYARLSVEDLGNKDGGTIENQILLVQKYIESKQYLKLYEKYIDNGETGTNFERNGFINLMEDIKRGKIDCIVVKDLSRFGRNYIETGNYLERVFPFLGVRFISINDGYDSHNTAKNGDNLTIVLKNLVNDMYVKDISKKIRTAVEIKRRKGDFVGGLTPYGYMKSPADKHKLIIDRETALTVRDVFQWKAEGMSSMAIARKLNENGVQSPQNYWYNKGILSHSRYAKKILWNDGYIRNMLANSVYIGHLAQGKRKNDISKSVKSTLQPREKWVVVENTHEAIIEIIIFEAIQKILADDSKKYNSKQENYTEANKTNNIFSGLMYCANCGKSLKRKYQTGRNGKRYYNYVCPSYSTDKSSGCTRKYISEIELKKAVYTAIKQKIALLSDNDTTTKINSFMQIENCRTKFSDGESVLQNEAQSLQQRLNRLNILKNSIYNDYMDGLLNQREYKYARQKYDTEYNQLNSRLNEISTELKKYMCNIENNKYVAEMRRFSNAEKLTKDMLKVFVEKIIVYNNRRIEIKYRYRNEPEQLNLNGVSSVYKSRSVGSDLGNGVGV